MDSGTKSLGDLVSSRVFHIPNFQRYYSWDDKQLEDLWIDLRNLQKNKEHYFGTVILKETSEKEETEGTFSDVYDIFKIIDGQQRLTTVAILLKIMISKMEEVKPQVKDSDELEERINNIRETYLRDKNVYMLKLLDDDDLFFRKHIIEGTEEPREEITPSQSLLWQAKEFFEEKFDKLKVESNSPEDFIKTCNRLKNKIENLKVMTYAVGEDEGERATLIFESVNDRGRNLSDLDKTKSFLMYMVYLSASTDKGNLERSLNTVREAFSSIYHHLQEIKDSEYGENLSEDDIQRFHYVGYSNWSKKEYQNLLNNLKRKVRKKYKENRNKCLNFIHNYSNSLENGFQNLKEILTFSSDDKVKELIDRIHALRHVAKFYPILILVWSQFKNEKEKLTRILRTIEIFSFRVYAIGNHPRYTARTSIYKVARNFFGESKTSDEWIQKLEDIIRDYEADKTFKSTLKSSNFYNGPASKDIRYLFFYYEKYLGHQAGEEVPLRLFDIMGEDYTIEHIWSQTPKNNLSPKKKEIYEKHKHKLGNLTLCSDIWNKKHGNKPFEEKQRLYKESSFRVQNQLHNYNRWDENKIENREDKIIEFVLNYWKLSSTSNTLDSYS